MRRTPLVVLAALAVGGMATADNAVGKRVMRVRVPDVLHLTPERAYDLARNKGFRVAIPKSFSAASNHSAQALQQSPRPGGRAPRGSALTFKVGMGGLGSPGGTVPPRHGTVPAVVGLRVPDATRQISLGHLRWNVRYSPLRPTRKARSHDNYEVTAQDPAPGTAWDDQQPPVQMQAGS